MCKYNTARLDHLNNYWTEINNQTQMIVWNVSNIIEHVSFILTATHMQRYSKHIDGRRNLSKKSNA